MIWATVSSWSCFCWLYRASPSLAAKNVIILILVLTIWWPCVESSLVLLEEGICYDQCVLLTKLLAFALLHSVLQGQIFLLLQVSLDFLLFIPVPYNEKDIFFPFQDMWQDTWGEFLEQALQFHWRTGSTIWYSGNLLFSQSSSGMLILQFGWVQQPFLGCPLSAQHSAKAEQ